MVSDDDYFRVGYDRFWPDWFHDAVSANKIITQGLGKFSSGDKQCFVHAADSIKIARLGSYVFRKPSGEITVLSAEEFNNAV